MKLTALLVLNLFSSLDFCNSSNTYQLTVQVDGLKNNNGVVQFALYNKEGSIPDEDFENYFQLFIGVILNGSSTVIFKNIPPGQYAVSILHDENKNGKIDKGFILPIEGVGFSNFQSIGLSNRPSFLKAKFEVKEDKKMNIKVVYM